VTKLTDALREHGVHNVHLLAREYTKATGERPPYITYRRGGVWDPTGHTVNRVWLKKDPEDVRESGTKLFPGHTAKGTSADAAKAWAAEKYGVTEWVTLPGFLGDFFTPEMAAWAKNLAKTTPGQEK